MASRPRTLSFPDRADSVLPSWTSRSA
jgi:hypothetical protein